MQLSWYLKISGNYGKMFSKSLTIVSHNFNSERLSTSLLLYMTSMKQSTISGFPFLLKTKCLEED